MLKKILILILPFYFLVLLQTSFLVHFSISSGWWVGWSPNFILLAVILINFFTPDHSELWWGVGSAFIGGFFLDIFSSSPIGFNVLILVALAFFIKIILKRYVRIPAF